MITRLRLPQRRASISFSLEVGGLHYTATVSYFADGRVGEVFINNHRTNSAADVGARDSGILLSLLLQHGCDIATIAHAITRSRDGTASGVVGAVLDALDKDGAP